MKIGHVTSERTSFWPILDQTMGWEKIKEEKIKRNKKREFKERDSTFSLNFPTIGQAEQEEEFILTVRASHRDRSWGVLTKTPRGRGFLLLGLILI